MKKFNLKHLCVSSLLVAMQVVLSRFASFQSTGMRISFGFIPIMMAALLFGPSVSGSVAIIADAIGALIWPTGAYHPGIALTALLTGIIYGLFLKDTTLDSIKFWIFALIAIMINNLGLGLFVNSLWLSQLYGSKTYWGWVTTRFISEYTIMVPLQIAFLPYLKIICKRVKKAIKL